MQLIFGPRRCKKIIFSADFDVRNDPRELIIVTQVKDPINKVHSYNLYIQMYSQPD